MIKWKNYCSLGSDKFSINVNSFLHFFLLFLSQDDSVIRILKAFFKGWFHLTDLNGCCMTKLWYMWDMRNVQFKKWKFEHGSWGEISKSYLFRLLKTVILFMLLTSKIIPLYIHVYLFLRVYMIILDWIMSLKKICWSPNPRYLWMWLYLETIFGDVIHVKRRSYRVRA